jgi:nucleoside-diphosphate-sugar epimerase
MKATILGVNGLTGRAMAEAFTAAGWTVTGTGRGPSRLPTGLSERVEFRTSDRTDPVALASLLDKEQPDVVVDCVCYTAEHARALVAARGSVGSAVVLSSKAVYVDEAGRHSNSDEPPRFGRPVSERDAVLQPDWSGEYASRAGYGSNKVAAEIVLQEAALPVSILRPSRIHGAGASPSREWFVVRRLLDGRSTVPLAHGGATGNHPTAASTLADLALVCAMAPGARLLNVADAGMPTAFEVVRGIAEAMGVAATVVGMADDAPQELGASPWRTWPPFFLDTSSAAGLGWHAPTYATAVRAAVDDLLSRSAAERSQLDRDPYFEGAFDYALDDAALQYAGQ